VLAIIMFPMVVTMFFFSRECITLILGDKFLPAVPAFEILSVVWGLMFMSVLFLRILTATNRQRLVPVCIGGALVVNLVLDLILIPRMGFIGAAYATLLAEITLAVTTFFCVRKHLMRLALGQFFWGPCVGAVLMALFCGWMFDAGLAKKIFLSFPIALLIYVGHILFTRTITMKEWRWFRDTIRRDTIREVQ
jgi:O-antigen/teichoic acid export membrane protein